MKALLASLFLVGLSSTVVAQSNYKESSNSFARYTKTGDIKQLESAKKFIDEAYKTKRDSSSRKNILLRAMVYSSLAYADSNRTIKTDRDPIDITNQALSKLKNKGNYEQEINYINQNLIAAHMFRANKLLAKNPVTTEDYKKAYADYLIVEKLGVKSEDVLQNLASLAKLAENNTEAIHYYTKLIKNGEISASNYLTLANLYQKVGDKQNQLQTLLEGREKLKADKKLLFALVDYYANEKSYNALAPLAEEVSQAEPENANLHYLLGFALENNGEIEKAKAYYNKTLLIDNAHYDASLALGLIYLDDFLNNKSNLEAQYSAQNYLLKANGLQPYAVNTLKGLSLFYEAAEDDEQLDRVKVLLNQLSNY